MRDCYGIPILSLFERHATEQGRTGVDELFRKSFAIRERVLGAEHPAVAQSLYNRAMLVEVPKVLKPWGVYLVS